MANQDHHDVVFEKLSEALEAEPDAFLPSHSSAPTAVEEMQEIEEIRQLAEVLGEPEPSSYAST